MALLAKSTGAEKKAARRSGKAASKRRPASRRLDKAASRTAERTLEKVGPRIEAAVETAAEWASPRLEAAKDVALERAAEAREWAEPRIESAAETINTEVVPRVQTALQQAAEATSPALEEAKVRGTRAMAALRGEELVPPTRKRRRGRKVLLVLLGASVAGAVAYVAWAKRSASGFDYYSLPADDYGRDEHGETGSAADTAPLGSVTEDRSQTDPALFGNPADEPAGTPDADATEAAEQAAKKTGGRRNTRSSG